MKKLLLAAAAVLALLGPANADYNITTPLTAPPNTTLQVVRAGVDGSGRIINYQSPIDATGAAFGTVGNPFALQFGSGVTLPAFASPPTVNLGSLNGAATASLQQSILTAIGSPLQSGGSVSISSGSVTISGSLPSFASVQHFICDSGCAGGGGGGGTSSNFGAAFPTAGTAIGVSTGGNMVALATGQQLAGASLPVVLTAAQLTTLTPPTSVGITGSVAVTGTFFQATQPISAASLPLPTGAATQTTLAGVLTALGSPFQAGGSIGNTSFGISGTLPAFAAPPKMNVCDQSTGANCITVNASGQIPVLQGGTWTVNAAQSGTWNVTNISGTISLPTGAATSANQILTQAPVAFATATATKADLIGAQFLTTQPTLATNTQQGSLLVSTRGELLVSPGVSGFPVTLTSTTITGTVASTQSGTWTNTVTQATGTNLHMVCDSGCSGSGGTSSTFGAAFPTIGTAIGMTQGGNMVALSGTSGNLNVQCANCSGSGVSTVDEATVTFGTSVFVGIGGAYQTTATSNPLTSGQQGFAQLTINRALHTNLRNSTGVEVGTAAAPLQVSLANTGANATAMLVTGTGGTFPVSQATAANLNATVVGTGTFAVQAAQSGTWNIGSITTLPALVAGSAIIGKVGIDQTTPGTTNLVAASQSGTWNITNISGTVSLPTGAATAALQPTNAAQGSTTSGQTGVLVQAAVLTAAPTYTTAQTSPLTMTTGGALRVADASVVTALGSPFQAGASIGNTSFGATQATAANLNATVVGTGTFAVQATLQASATTAIGKVDPNTIATWGLVVSTQNSATPTNMAVIAGQFNTTPTTITSGNVSALQLDNAGNLLVNIKAGASSGAVAQGSTTSGQTGGLTQAAALSAAPTYSTGTTNPLSMDLAGNLRVTVAAAIGLAQGSTTSGQTGSLIMGAVTTSAPSYTTTQTSPLSLDTAGNVRMSLLTALPAGTNTIGAVIGPTADGSAASTAPVLIAGTVNGTATGAVAIPAISAAGVVSTQDSSTGATGSAVPANAAYTGSQGSNGLAGQITCDQSAVYDASTSGSTQLVALSSGKSIYVCGWTITTGAAATNVKLIYGTGAACVTSPQPVLPAFQLAANSGVVDSSAIWGGIKTAASQELCINTNGANAVQAVIKYAQF